MPRRCDVLNGFYEGIELTVEGPHKLSRNVSRQDHLKRGSVHHHIDQPVPPDITVAPDHPALTDLRWLNYFRCDGTNVNLADLRAMLEDATVRSKIVKVAQRNLALITNSANEYSSNKAKRRLLGDTFEVLAINWLRRSIPEVLLDEINAPLYLYNIAKLPIPNISNDAYGRLDPRGYYSPDGVIVPSSPLEVVESTAQYLSPELQLHKIGTAGQYLDNSGISQLLITFLTGSEGTTLVASPDHRVTTRNVKVPWYKLDTCIFRDIIIHYMPLTYTPANQPVTLGQFLDHHKP